jgi:hypothetical protein
MPKQFKTYSRFEGGLNTVASRRDIADSELSRADDVIVDELGVIRTCGRFTDNTSDYNATIGATAVQPGYGLFQARFDYDTSNNNTSPVATFFANADNGSNCVVRRADNNGSFSDAITLGAVTGSYQGKVIYHLADGFVRACDTNVNNVSTAIKKYGFIKTTDRWLSASTGNAITPGSYAGTTGFSTFDTKLSKPTRGICSKGLRSTTASSGSSTELISSVSGAFPSSTDTELSTGAYHAKNITDNTEDAITGRSSATVLDTASSGADFGTGGESYGVYPPAGTGFNLHFSTTSSGGSWEAGDYEFASTFLYDGNQESLPYVLSGELTVSANDSITCTVLATENKSSTRYADNIVGGRIYFRKKDSDNAFQLFGEINFRQGTRPTLDGTFTGWAAEYANDHFVYSIFVSTSINIDTYESINGFNQDSAFISIGENGEKYQTSLVSNRRAFIANVRYTNPEGVIENRGDKIRYSEIGKFDTFPEFNFLDIGVNDGEDFIKIESYADRLLAFKEKTLYIINISGGSDTQWFLEAEYKTLGISFQGAVVKTDLGIAWANKNGLYLYDGSKIVNLQNKIIYKSSVLKDWNSHFTDTSILGYEPTKKHLVLMRSCQTDSEVGDSSDAYVYSFMSKSFTFINDIVGNTVNTNFITDLHNNLSVGSGINDIHSYDGESDDGESFDIILKNDDFGLPGVAKKVYAIYVEYGSSAAQANAVKFRTTSSVGVGASSGSGGTTAGSLASISSDLTYVNVDRFTTNLPVTCNSFEVRLLSPGGSSGQIKITNVTVEYRPIYKRIT